MEKTSGIIPSIKKMKRMTGNTIQAKEELHH
jgi:hypothetical protein